MAENTPQSNPVNKKVSYGTGAGLGSGVTVTPVIVWMWNSSNPDNPMPAEVAAALGAIITAVIGFIVGYRKHS